MWALGREPRASLMLGRYPVTELEPLSCPQMNFYCLKKKRTRSSKIKVPSGLCIIQSESSKPCRLQTKSSLHIKITGVTIKNKMEYVTVKLVWDLAERRIKQTQSIQRQQRRNRKVPTQLCEVCWQKPVISAQEAEAGGWSQVQSQPVLHSENLSQHKWKTDWQTDIKGRKKSIV